MPRCMAQLFTPDNSDAMLALNSAMMTDGVVIEIADNAVIPLPLHIVHIASGAAPAAMFTRSLLRVGKPTPARRWWKATSAPRARKAYQVNDSLIDCDRRRRAARPCPPDRGRPRGLQHLLRRGDARRATRISRRSA